MKLCYTKREGINLLLFWFFWVQTGVNLMSGRKWLCWQKLNADDY